MTEELDFLGQDSDGGSEEVVLTPAELIERLEQVSIPDRIPLLQSAFLFSSTVNIRDHKMRKRNLGLISEQGLDLNHLHGNGKQEGHPVLETSSYQTQHPQVGSVRDSFGHIQ